MTLEDEPPPELGKEVKVYELGRSTENECVTPIRAKPLHRTYFHHAQVGAQQRHAPAAPSQQSLISDVTPRGRSAASIPSKRQLDEPRPYRGRM
ncbi:unnamed protein product [Ranitomeya imitator]|uniref:Uncharacterized protein n=1 Tax=Ranitomeya imitator TaxID=111125 RepID=A0ABN9MHY0_9NEOB|nr:unnamed protein product [Ranitomeya imitator]